MPNTAGVQNHLIPILRQLTHTGQTLYLSVNDIRDSFCLMTTSPKYNFLNQGIFVNLDKFVMHKGYLDKLLIPRQFLHIYQDSFNGCILSSNIR